MILKAVIQNMSIFSTVQYMYVCKSIVEYWNILHLKYIQYICKISVWSANWVRVGLMGPSALKHCEYFCVKSANLDSESKKYSMFAFFLTMMMIL
jgi:hypothetical protein